MPFLTALAPVTSRRARSDQPPFIPICTPPFTLIFAPVPTWLESRLYSYTHPSLHSQIHSHRIHTPIQLRLTRHSHLIHPRHSHPVHALSQLLIFANGIAAQLGPGDLGSNPIHIQTPFHLTFTSRSHPHSQSNRTPCTPPCTPNHISIYRSIAYTTLARCSTIFSTLLFTPHSHTHRIPFILHSHSSCRWTRCIILTRPLQLAPSRPHPQ